MVNEPSISIHILNYNGKRFLKGCLDSVFKQNYSNFEVVVVDNGSSDDSVKFIHKNYKKQIKNKKLYTLSLNKNYGVPEAYNRSYDAIKSDYFLMLNNDVICNNKNMLKSLVKTMKEHNCAIVGGWELPVDKNIKVSLDKTGVASVLGTTIPGEYSENMDIFVGGSACALIDRSKIKFFDYPFPSKYFAYGEDIYLFWRCKLKGYSIRFDKNAKYLHYGAGTSNKSSTFIRYHSEKNRNANLLIFYEAKTLLKLFPLLLFENLIKLCYYIFKPKYIAAWFRAIFWDVWNIGYILSERKKIQQERIMTDKYILSYMSHRIFPEYMFPKFSIMVNKISKAYCKFFKISVER
jgi:GT2 family glycosyltransferase